MPSALKCLLFAGIFSLGGCMSAPTGPVAPPTVVVAVAADLQYAFEEMMLDFHRVHPDVVVRPTFGSSGTLFSQISNNAPFDVFLAADVEYVKRLADMELIDRTSLFVYGESQLVIWVREDSSLPIDQEGIKVLLDPRVKKISIADPKHSPYGRAAQELLNTTKLADQVASKLVLGENAAQSAQLVENGSANVGIIAKSLALSPPLRAFGKFAEVPKNSFKTMIQGGGIMTNAKDRASCEKLLDYITSPRGRTILSEYGLRPPKED
ncbi:molybdate ABC transporter substrate-binding protein [bacterium]|nr:molybdate ABC transporter substrate-binding protein [bacterium]